MSSSSGAAVTATAIDGWMHELDDLECPPDAEFLYDTNTDAGARRKSNLRRYLTLIAQETPPFMLIGEAPGYRGTTVTGIPFMSIRQASSRPGLITRDPSGDGFAVAPIDADGPPPWEATSGFMWKALDARSTPAPLLWSTYPHHPFVLGDPSSNRRPRPDEIRRGIPLAISLASLFGITRFIAVGRVAEQALATNGVEATPVRHPAQGGAAIFAAQMAELLSARD